ncbi:response regulator [Acetobacter thailandicus]|uniref:histidine kinase n=1 Tax=Acetobacter thailandicus TaxID=1502842 RepID=A0ABT3QDV3_9PROT|nr:response regulator [Acetobacter thailandicus]MCX2563450.1 response regulator [Acetobacter thailandicus]NHN94204.1 response regulator [Acetobacter thailandicus]
MARHPARRAHILALIGAGLLIVTFGTMSIELGNEMARRGNIDRQSTTAGSYLRTLHRATSRARICYYAWLARNKPDDASCYSKAIGELENALSDYSSFRSVQERVGANRIESLNMVGQNLQAIAAWPSGVTEMPQGGESLLSALDENLSVLSRVSTLNQAGRVADMLRNTGWQRRLLLLGVLTGVLSLIAAGWVLDRSSLVAARAEASSRDLALRLRATLDSLSLGMAVFGADGRLWHWNEQLSLILGLKKDFLKLGLHYDELNAVLVAGNMSFLEPFGHIKPFLDRGEDVPPVLTECKGPDGADLEVCRTFFFAADGAASRHGFVLTIADISLRLRSERALGEAQKLRALGQLTAGIAHDFKNLLTVILGNLELVTDYEGPEDIARRQEYIFAATHAARRSEALTGQLLSFMRRQTTKPDSLMFSDLFSFLNGLLARVIGSHIMVECCDVAGVWPVRADPAQLESAVLNLAINARDAMTKGGKLKIEARNVVFAMNTDLMSLPLEEGRHRRVVSDPTPLPAGNWVRLDVTDTGSGMTDDVLHRLFEPFFTTKGEGAGTGLGMPMVLAFSQQVNGRVMVETGTGHGTVVSLWLPCAATTCKLEETKVLVADTAVKTEACQARVLVVEDDAAIRDIVVTIMQMAGHEVLEAEDGKQAIEIATQQEKLDLLITDIQLPAPFDGLALSQVLSGQNPGLAVVYMSGELTSESANLPGGVEGASYLAKPFRRKELVQAVATALNKN